MSIFIHGRADSGIVIEAQLPEHLVSKINPVRQQTLALTPAQTIVLYDWLRREETEGRLVV